MLSIYVRIRTHHWELSRVLQKLFSNTQIYKKSIYLKFVLKISYEVCLTFFYSIYFQNNVFLYKCWENIYNLVQKCRLNNKIINIKKFTP
jgi:hypothetical protein